MLVISRFTVPVEQTDWFREQGRRALAAFAARPGHVRGRLGRSSDDPAEWVLTTEWDGVGSYRRSLSNFDVRVATGPLLAHGRDEPGAFEVLDAEEGGRQAVHPSRRAADAATVGVGEAPAPAVPSSPGPVGDAAV